MNYNSTHSKHEPLYSFDWLGGIGVLLLLFVHCAEIFVSCKFWMKNDEMSEVLSVVTASFFSWRMPLLFIISGAVVATIFERKCSRRSLKERFQCFVQSLVFAMFFVIPPEIYFLRKYQSSTESFERLYQHIPHFDFSFYRKGASISFICGSVVFLPVMLYLKSEKEKFYGRMLAEFVSKSYSVLYLGTNKNNYHGPSPGSGSV